MCHALTYAGAVPHVPAKTSLEAFRTGPWACTVLSGMLAVSCNRETRSSFLRAACTCRSQQLVPGTQLLSLRAMPNSSVPGFARAEPRATCNDLGSCDMLDPGLLLSQNLSNARSACTCRSCLRMRMRTTTPKRVQVIAGPSRFSRCRN